MIVVYVASECILFFMYSIFNFVSIPRQQPYCFEYWCSLLQNVHIMSCSVMSCCFFFFSITVQIQISFFVIFSVNRVSCVKHTYGNVHTHGNICQILENDVKLRQWGLILCGKRLNICHFHSSELLTIFKRKI